PLVSVHDSDWVPDWDVYDSASIWLNALLVPEPTVSEYVAEWLPEAAEPGAVMEYVPAAGDDGVDTGIGDGLAAGAGGGAKPTLTPAGAPEADRLTDWALPEVTAVPTVAVVEPPAVTEPDEGDSETEKSFVVPPPGSEEKCGATVLAKPYPLVASQLTDQ